MASMTSAVHGGATSGDDIALMRSMGEADEDVGVGGLVLAGADEDGLSFIG